MGIIQFIDRISAQVACYWGSPVNDGSGGYTYADPVEIKCRWDDVQKLINNSKGEEVISNATIMTNSVLAEGGMLYLGTLADFDNSDIAVLLNSGQFYPYPNQVPGACRIVTFDKTPLFRSATKFVYTYYLKPNWETKL